MARIVSIVFDKNERPLRATIRTKRGTVKVRWTNVCGDWCWLSTGNLDGKSEAVPEISRIEQI